MKNFRDLKVWEKAHKLTLDVYRSTKEFPKEEQYGITGQIRRASASIPANIAEGCGRGSDTDMARFVQIALGSASEVEYHALLAHDLTLLNDANYRLINEQVCEVKRMLASLLRKLRAES